MKPRMTPEQALAALATMTPDDFPAAAPEDELDDATVQHLIESGRSAMEKRVMGRPSDRTWRAFATDHAATSADDE